MQENLFVEPVHNLTPDQTKALKEALRMVRQKKFYPFLIHGVTGSGKTEIYLKLMEQALSIGRQCLYLVPEIALTTQLWDRISSRLATSISMLHSSLTNAERFDAWRMIKKGEVNVVMGARSAIFAPFPDTGLIIVDEEHDGSYKQDDGLRYNARDISLLKGKFSNAVVVLGSATPCLESYHNAMQKKYGFERLPDRVENKPLPAVQIIDMKTETARQKKKGGIVSEELQKAIKQRLKDGQQSILFLNRRGFARAFLCRQCGFTFSCPNCDLSLIHHSWQKKLRCHYCDFSIPLPEECPECDSYFLTSLGWGTERLEGEIKQLFPDARTARMDRDTTSSGKALRIILKDVYAGKIDILIGTQMIAKGYHLPGVTLVGVLCADHSLNFPDYRASERTFQLLTQVAGRAGRGDVSGEVIIQTYNPDHYSIVCARTHDFKKFYEIELRHRKELGYPPFSKIINVRFEGEDRRKVEACSHKTGQIARKILACSCKTALVEILGPCPAPLERIKNRYRYHMILKCGNIQQLRALTSTLLEQTKKYINRKDVKLIIDVDPIFIM